MLADSWLCCTEVGTHYVIGRVPEYREVPVTGDNDFCAEHFLPCC